MLLVLHGTRDMAVLKVSIEEEGWREVVGGFGLMRAVTCGEVSSW